MRRLLIAFAGTALLAGLAVARPETPKPKPSIRCTLTGKKIESCCCEQRGEKIYCSLAKKEINKCCCEPVQSPKPKKG